MNASLVSNLHLSIAIVILGSACATITPARNLAIDPQPVHQERAARKCAIFVEEPKDERPEHERRGGEQTELNLVFPIVPVLWFQTSSGFTLHDPQLIGGPTVLGTLREGFGLAIANSKVCNVVPDLERASHVLRVSVEHLYGINRLRERLFLIWVGLVTMSQDYHPAGHVALRFELVDRKTSTALAKWRMSEGSLMHRDQEGIAIRENKKGIVAAEDPEANRLAQIVEAVSKVYRRLPDRLDAYLGQHIANGSTFSPQSFTIARILPDYEHVELAVIDFETGRVTSSVVAIRSWPVVSRAGEWFVPPYQPNLLSTDDYAKLIHHLEKRYDVRWERNLAVAAFHGIRAAELNASLE